MLAEEMTTLIELQQNVGSTSSMQMSNLIRSQSIQINKGQPDQGIKYLMHVSTR